MKQFTLIYFGENSSHATISLKIQIHHEFCLNLFLYDQIVSLDDMHD